jgi:hypothetical protein
MTINEDPVIVGSAKYNIKYYSDLDIFDKSVVNLSRTQAIHYYINMLQDVAYKIKISKYGNGELYLTDFKIGMDHRFIYDPENDDLDEKLQIWKPLISEFEYNNLLNHQDIEDLLEQIRLLSILRWTIADVLVGYKIHHEHKFTLSEAISSSGIIKCDCAVFNGTRYISLEIFYLFEYINGVFFDMGDYIKSIKQDLRRFISNRFYNPLKFIKRLWVYERLTGNDCRLLTSITQFLDSPTNALNSSKGSLEALRDLLLFSNLEKLIVERSILTVLDVKKLVLNNLEPKNLPEGLLLFNILTDSKFERQKFIDDLNLVIEFLYRIIVEESEIFLKQLKLIVL